MSEDNRVVQFYNYQTIFLTGATGFIGKVILEKLLRDFPKVPKIYLLVRPKKGKTRKERFDQLFESPCFNRLKDERKDFHSQVHLVEGDCDEPELGLDEHDRRLLISDVTMVIHAAANVKFEQDLKSAANNLKAAMKVVELCEQMPKLTALVYVSTAFSNCLHSHIKEEFYMPPMSSEVFLALVEELDDERLEAITPGLLGPWPNTYVYVKSIIEDYLRRNCGGIPTIVVRPSVVVNALREPEPGWTDSIYGPTGVGIASFMGVARSAYAKKHIKAQLVPVDTVCNIILLAGWDRARMDKTTKVPVKIFNAVGENDLLITWNELVMTPLKLDIYWKGLPSKQFWYNSFTITENRLWHKTIIFFGHTIVAHFADTILFLFGQERLAVKNYARLNKMLDLISYFTTRTWTMDRKNLDQLNSELNESERQLLKTTHEGVVLEEYFKESLLVWRSVFFKENLETLNVARAKFICFGILHYSFLAFLWYLFYRVLVVLYQFFV